LKRTPGLSSKRQGYTSPTMSSLRHKPKKGAHGAEDGDDDIEALINQDSPAKGSTSPPRGASNNPVFLAKAIFRKVFDILAATDEDEGGIITAAKDIFIGIMCALIVISLMIFLDHHNVIHFQSAHTFRTAAFQMLNDAETITNLEESSSLKFMTMADYESLRKEIEGARQRITSAGEVLEKRTKEVDESEKELVSIRAEHESFHGNPLLGLNKFCGACVWAGKVSCDGRVVYMQDTYKSTLIQAQFAAMEIPTCIT